MLCRTRRQAIPHVGNFQDDPAGIVQGHSLSLRTGFGRPLSEVFSAILLVVHYAAVCTVSLSPIRRRSNNVVIYQRFFATLSAIAGVTRAQPGVDPERIGSVETSVGRMVALISLLP